MTYRYQDLAEYDWLMPEILKHETSQALALGQLLYDVLLPKSVIDIGCGPGIYLKTFADLGWKVYGIDGAPAAGQCLLNECFELVDLRNPWTPDCRYDLAICVEVAEHLQPIHADTLVATICACSDTIFFTAARPDQGGESHLNEQPREYWLEKFSKFRIGLHPRNDEVMRVINSDPVYEHCGWIRWNGMLLGKLPAG